MDIKSGIQMAKLATALGWIDEKDWKTPKIIFNSHRKAVTRKAVHNATKTGCSLVRGYVEKRKWFFMKLEIIFVNFRELHYLIYKETL